MTDATSIKSTSRRRYGTAHWLAGLLKTVDAITPKGAILFVHSHAAIPGVRALVRARHDAETVARTRVVAAPIIEDEEPFRAVGLPILRCPFVAEQRAYTTAVFDAIAASGAAGAPILLAA